MSEAPLVSIVLPCYNAAAFLAETLDSVIAQTFGDWECIAVDDASSDGTAGVLEDYARRDPRIRPRFLPRNGGAAASRNAGLAGLRGRYLAFLDADDLWEAEKLRLQVERLKATGAALSHTSYRFINEAGAPMPGGVKAAPRVDLRRYLRTTEIGMSTAVLDRDQVGAFEFRDIRICQDTHLWLALLRRGFISEGLPEPLVKYRVREGQISGSKIAMARQVFALYEEIGEIPAWERRVSFAFYAANGLRKRLVSPF